MDNRLTLVRILWVAFLTMAAVGVVSQIAVGDNTTKTCLSRNRAVGKAVLLYIEASDTVAPLTAYRSFEKDRTPSNKTWVEMVQPYGAKWTDFRCNADSEASDEQLARYPFSDKLALNDEERHWTWGVRSNRGYNMQYLCPIVTLEDGKHQPLPQKLYSARYLSSSILCTDSVYEIDADGNPSGGGIFIVDPPCFYMPDGEHKSWPLLPERKSFWWSGGWLPSKGTYGNVYGFHEPQFTRGEKSATTRERQLFIRLVPTLFLDGHTSALTIRQLASGCDMKEQSSGRITELDAYLWDMR